MTEDQLRQEALRIVRLVRSRFCQSHGEDDSVEDILPILQSLCCIDETVLSLLARQRQALVFAQHGLTEVLNEESGENYCIASVDVKSVIAAALK